MKYKVYFTNNNKTVEVSEGTTILEAEIACGMEPDAPCGGKGICKKCQCLIKNGSESVLACQYKIHEDLVVTLPNDSKHVLLEEGLSRKIELDPAIKCLDGKEIFAAAFDIGTTSVVCYLLSLKDGSEKAKASMLNPQCEFGADVISRADYAINNGVEKLTKCIRKALNELIEKVCMEAKISNEDIYEASIVGNTCMHHLYMGIDPKPLVIAPYNAVVKDELELKPEDANLNINKNGKLFILPNIAGFVGADTSGVLLATAFDEKEELTLVIDIGTNGEMALGTKEKFYVCSTAAGPAFEGAKIECGMRGREGAIEHVKLNEKGEIVCKVIADKEAEGICGSGLLDAAAVLLEKGIVEESGRMECEKFFLTEKVYIAQKDIREIQLAKSAICTGIMMLAQKLGVKICDIKEVLLAGAFGNYMDPESACKIGLIPSELQSKIKMIGNAAGEGAKLAVLSYPEFLRAQKIADKADFVELASEKDFQDMFVDNLEF